MATYPPPANEQGSIFNPDTWIQQPLDSVDTAFLDANYCRFPVAQGNMNFSTTNTAGNIDAAENIVLNGTYLTNYIQFPDGSQQFAASAGGTGDALLSGGTSSVPQNFTGYNEFSNADGQITLTNTTGLNTIIVSADETDIQLNVGGNLSIGNTANTNTIVLSSSATYTKQLDIAGYFNIQNATNSLSVTIASDATNTNQLDIQGALSVGNSTNTNSVILNSAAGSSTALQINGGLTIYSSGGAYLVEMTSNNTTDNQLDINGQVTISNSTNGNSVLLASDTTTNNQLNVSGDLLTTGNITLGSGSTTGASLTFGDGSVQTVAYTGQAPSGTASLSAGTSTTPQIFTGYNQINNLRFNGMSCPQAIINLVNQYQTGLGSQWIWTTGIPYTLGNGFAFAFSTNNTPTPYTVASQEVIVPQANGVISGTGYALLQPYTYNSVNYNAYVLSITGYSGTASLSARTVANNMGFGYPYYAIQTNDNNSYYSNNNIKMTLYIYPQAIV